MNKKLLSILLICFVTPSIDVQGWGFYAHKRINRVAVFTLPYEMLAFYKSYIEYITEQAVAPDKRRFLTEGEAPKHYIDIDHYGEFPFGDMPRKWMDAVEKYSEDTLLAYGILPWNIQQVYYQLVNAFKEKDKDRILKLSGDLGHYIADAHVPLHTTRNYNGQLTNQVGIHGLWESRLPELFARDYDYFTGKAEYISDPLMRAWDMVLGSHAGLDSVLSFERELDSLFSPDKKYSHEERGARVVKVYSREFSNAYHDKLAGQVERRMRESIKMTGSYWFSAWVDAGQPDLSPFINPDFDMEAVKDVEVEYEQYNKGEWKGRPDL